MAVSLFEDNEVQQEALAQLPHHGELVEQDPSSTNSGKLSGESLSQHSISSMTGSKPSFFVRSAGEPSRPSTSEAPSKSEGPPTCLLLARRTLARQQLHDVVGFTQPLRDSEVVVVGFTQPLRVVGFTQPLPKWLRHGVIGIFTNALQRPPTPSTHGRERSTNCVHDKDSSTLSQPPSPPMKYPWQRH